MPTSSLNRSYPSGCCEPARTYSFPTLSGSQLPIYPSYSCSTQSSASPSPRLRFSRRTVVEPCTLGSRHRTFATRAPPQRCGWLHVGGASPTKGTAVVVRTWEEHPHWPVVTIVASGDWRPSDVPPNVRYMKHRLSARALRRLQNASAVHLCPSQAEGYGHTIVEAMCCHAIVVTTDAPPMNELVDETRGVLVGTTQGERRCLVRDRPTSPSLLARGVERVLAMQPEECDRLRRTARTWYEENARGFPNRLHSALQSVLGGTVP